MFDMPVACLRWGAIEDRHGQYQALIHDDDRLRAAIRDLIDDTEQPAPAGTPR